MTTIQLNTVRRLRALDFTDRDSYIAWRAEWRELIKRTTTQVRQIRKARTIVGALRSKNAAAVDEADRQFVDMLTKGLQAQQNYTHYFWGFDSWRSSEREYGRTMMEIRKESKLKAQEQYLSAKLRQATVSLQSTVPSLEAPAQVAV